MAVSNGGVQEGFARLSMHQYSLDAESIDNKFIHLTNAAIQKDSTETADTILRARCAALRGVHVMGVDCAMLFG